MIGTIHFPTKLTPFSSPSPTFIQSLHQLAWSPILSSPQLQAFLSAYIHETSGRPLTQEKIEFWWRCSCFDHHDSEWYWKGFWSLGQEVLSLSYAFSSERARLAVHTVMYFDSGKLDWYSMCVTLGNFPHKSGPWFPHLWGGWSLRLPRSLLGGLGVDERSQLLKHISVVWKIACCNEDPSLPWPRYWNRT